MQISVIMGVYNAELEKSFYRSIESILNQETDGFELEFVICDDGSTDKTYFMLLQQAELDRRIVLLKNRVNMGLGAALNRCIAAASGEILIRQDIDDFSCKNRIIRLLGELEKAPSLAFVGSDILLYNNLSDGAFDFQKRSYPSRPKSRDFLFSIPFMHGSIAMRKSVILEAGGYDESCFCTGCEDYELFMRMYSRGFFGGNLDLPLYFYKEDFSSIRRRKYRYRFNEAYVRFRGFCSLGLLPIGILYVIKPLIVGLIPIRLLLKLKKYRLGHIAKKSL